MSPEIIIENQIAEYIANTGEIPARTEISKQLLADLWKAGQVDTESSNQLGSRLNYFYRGIQLIIV